MARCYIHSAAGICALGETTATIAERLFTTAGSPLLPSDRYSPGHRVPLGECRDLPDVTDTRNNNLLAAVLEQLAGELDLALGQTAPERIGVVIGSSTSGIAEGSAAIRRHLHDGTFPAEFRYHQQEMFAPAEFVARTLRVKGPAWTVSTACTSGAKALASGARLLTEGHCDLVIAGGVDSLCDLTVQGFSALEAISPQLCNPFSRNRCGINIGEGAALFLLTRDAAPVALRGTGECSDAHHISAPHPQGEGAAMAMQLALANAGLTPRDIEYLNTHGTATEQNDLMESLAIARVLGLATPCGSTKPLTGHTLGAAGALEALFCWLTLQREDGMLPRHLWDGQTDAQLPPLARLGLERTAKPVTRAMSNSFAFGGNNISMIFERTR